MTTAIFRKDVDIPDGAPTTFLRQLHVKFIKRYNQHDADGSQLHADYVMSDYLRINGIYWCVTAMDIIGELHEMDESAIMDYIRSCFDAESGGYSPAPGHDPHILSTLSAVQIALTFNRIADVQADAIRRYVLSLFQPDDGSFVGDAASGERDTRFSFCSVACLKLIDRLPLHRSTDDSVRWTELGFNLDQAVDFVRSSMNFDGGFGSAPGNESHAGNIYCCISFLAVVGRLNQVVCPQVADRLGWWLAERQLPRSGGLNGRPEKLPDVCYGWWVLASLAIIDRLHWVSEVDVMKFMLTAQDNESGGFSDRPGDIADPFHTLFGIAGLSLVANRSLVRGLDTCAMLQKLMGNHRLQRVDPVFCMTDSTLSRLHDHI